MIDAIIRENAGREVVFDFESPAGVEPITYFYQGFGASPVRFQSIHFDNLPFYISFIKKTRKFIFQKVFSSASGK
jgi:hypothetical protein